MMRCLTICSAVLAFGVGATAQEPWENWQTKWSAEAVLVAAPDSEGVLGASGEEALYGAWLRFDVDRVLESGVEIGARVAVEGQKDHPARAGFSGGVPIRVLGPTEIIAPPVRGAYSGLSAYDSGAETDARSSFETAFVFVKGGYGEARLGRDQGVAARFHEGAPSVFTAAKLDSPSSDPTGSSIIRTDHDLTGPSAKLTVTSPRLLGVRAGVSFTPEADARGVDRDPAASDAIVGRVSIENAVEVAVNMSRRLPESGVRLRGGAALSSGEASAPTSGFARYGRVETWSIGGSAEFDTVTVGASALGSNNGIDGVDGDYSAWSLGVTKEWSGIVFGAEYGAAEDEIAGFEAESWSIGASKAFSDHVTGAIGYQNQTIEAPALQRPFSPLRDGTAQGIVVEITLSL